MWKCWVLKATIFSSVSWCSFCCRFCCLMHWKMHFEMKSNVGRGTSVSKKALHWDVAGAPWTDQVYLSRMSLNPFHPWSFWQITCVTYKTFRLIKYLFQEESIEEISSPPPTRRQQLLLLLSRFSHVRLCATPETAAQQASLSLGFSRQEHWSGLPFPSPMRESEKWKWSRSVMSDPQRPHGLQPSRLLHPWDFPGTSAGVGCHCLLQRQQYWNIVPPHPQSCPGKGSPPQNPFYFALKYK